jgi:hypothetical protein
MEEQMPRLDPRNRAGASGRRVASTLSRDLVRDWGRWSTAERVAAGSILAALLAQVPILVLAAAHHAIT